MDTAMHRSTMGAIANPKGRHIYEALIVAGQTTASDIARRTSIKRPTVYVHLEELIGAGLVERVLVNKKTLFRASDPSVLYQHLEKDRKDIGVLSQLFADHQVHFGRPGVRVFEGTENIVRLYEEIPQADSIRAWFGLPHQYDQFGDVPFLVSDRIRERKVTMRDIIPNDPAAIAFARKMRRLSGPTYAYRISSSKEIDNDTLIYGNCVAIMSLHGGNIYAVRIEDRSVAHTFRTIFDMSWKSLKS